LDFDHRHADETQTAATQSGSVLASADLPENEITMFTKPLGWRRRSRGRDLWRVVTLLSVAVAATPAAHPGDLPAWVQDAGAQRAPTGEKVYASKLRCRQRRKTLATAAIQQRSTPAPPPAAASWARARHVPDRRLFMEARDLGSRGRHPPRRAGRDAYPTRDARGGIEMEWPRRSSTLNDQQN